MEPEGNTPKPLSTPEEEQHELQEDEEPREIEKDLAGASRAARTTDGVKSTKKQNAERMKRNAL